VTSYRRYRIKEPKRSLDFYTRVLGFTLLEKLDFPEAKFSLYFLGQYSQDAIPEDTADRVSVPPTCSALSAQFDVFDHFGSTRQQLEQRFRHSSVPFHTPTTKKMHVFEDILSI